MKVVIFCGGHGLRMRSGVDSAPKPMMTIGDRPVLWHVMRYYAHFGHTEFILPLGFGGSSVKEYFLRYEETVSNDFVMTKGGQQIELLDSDISEWKITFVDTGVDTSIGERLRRVRPYLEDDDVFLANYGDVLTDAPMDKIVDNVIASDVTASLLAVPPQASFHVVEFGTDSRITGLRSASDLNVWINGGYFVLKKEIFDVLGEGEDLVGDAFPRLAAMSKLEAIPHHGFWAPMDTLKERSQLEELYRSGKKPWALWSHENRNQHGRIVDPQTVNNQPANNQSAAAQPAAAQSAAAQSVGTQAVDNQPADNPPVNNQSAAAQSVGTRAVDNQPADNPPVNNQSAAAQSVGTQTVDNQPANDQSVDGQTVDNRVVGDSVVDQDPVVVAI